MEKNQGIQPPDSDSGRINLQRWSSSGNFKAGRCLMSWDTKIDDNSKKKDIDQSHYFQYSGNMDINDAVLAFDALSQETRLKVFRLLVDHGLEGVSAGIVSEKLGIPPNTLSFHLSHMSNAGLVSSRREGRSIIYRANLDFFTDLIRYMIEDCCSAEVASIRSDKKKGCRVIELSNRCAPLKKEEKS